MLRHPRRPHPGTSARACPSTHLCACSGEAPQLRHRVCLGPDAPESMLGWGDLRWIGSGGAGGGLAGELRQRQRHLRPSEPANIQFTSGAGQPGLLA